jgi:hypothetical protein
MKKEQSSLYEKYFQGESSQEEESLLKDEILANPAECPEKAFFTYFRMESETPEDLDDQIFSKVDRHIRYRTTRFKLYTLTSVAATFALIITLYAGYRNGKKNERDFRMIEQALYHVSETLQPEPEEPEMFVLWVDNNVEIIVN